MASKKKPNMIPSHSIKNHYNKGKWKIDKGDDANDYTDETDYAQQNPQYRFSLHNKGDVNPKTGKPYKYSNNYVGIHSKSYGQEWGPSTYKSMTHGGAVVRIGERKLK